MDVTLRFGIDVGGVIIDGVKGDSSDTSMFKGRYLETPEVEGAIDTIAKLGAGRFKGNLFIVSKAGDQMRARTMEWLTHRDFWARTGMEKCQAHFTYDRAGKAPIAQKLGLTHFVDDRMEILAYLSAICDHRYLFQGSKGEAARWKNEKTSAVVSVESWKELSEKLS